MEFDDFIFFCVLLTNYELQNKNLRKLEYILAKILPIKINFDNSEVIKQAFEKLKLVKDVEERAEIRMQLVHWYLEMQDIDEAIKILEELVLEFPSHYAGSRKLLQLKSKIKDNNIIISELNRYFNLDPKNPTIYNDLLEIFSTDFELLIDFFKNEIKRSKDKHILGNLYFYLAQITKDKKLQNKYLLKARTFLSSVLSIDNHVFKTIDNLLNSLNKKTSRKPRHSLK